MTELEALKEVERLARGMVDDLDGVQLKGECDTECGNSEDCGKVFTVSTDCPKCGEKFDVEAECDGVFECHSTCTADVQVDLPDEDAEALKQLRLALVQLDIARAAQDTPPPSVASGFQPEELEQVGVTASGIPIFTSKRAT